MKTLRNIRLEQKEHDAIDYAVSNFKKAMVLMDASMSRVKPFDPLKTYIQRAISHYPGKILSRNEGIIKKTGS